MQLVTLFVGVGRFQPLRRDGRTGAIPVGTVQHNITNISVPEGSLAGNVRAAFRSNLIPKPLQDDGSRLAVPLAPQISPADQLKKQFRGASKFQSSCRQLPLVSQVTAAQGQRRPTRTDPKIGFQIGGASKQPMDVATSHVTAM